MTNRLAQETSPYLLQHADNPVDWFPWGNEALEAARALDKPIFLSIGYSACHWCHVMEHESFSNEATAKLLNQHFVCVKVDREERPDLDAIYMDAVTALTGRGGWPLSVWLTPEGLPFYGGTYFPDSPRYGAPSFGQVITAVSDAWDNRRSEIDNGAVTIHQSLLHQTARTSLNAGEALQTALGNLAQSFDSSCGGWGGAPKFPAPMVLEFLMASWQSNHEEWIRRQVEQTLQSMAFGGVFDQLGGGFHRYSTDAEWLVPHFEKMLYDNAQLARCYIHAWQLFGQELYRSTAEKTLNYMLAEMRHERGGFFSSQDADSEGVEGKFFVWSLDEIRAALSPEEAELFIEVYGITKEGNFEGKNVLRVTQPIEDENSIEMLDVARSRLLSVRGRRVRPARDDKVLASWNGLALAAFAEAAKSLGSERYLQAALDLAAFITSELMTPEYVVSRSWKDGRRKGAGFLEDHVCLAEGFLALYQATFDEAWFDIARRLADSVLKDFRRPEGGFYDTSAAHSDLIMRPRTVQDSPTPSGNSLAGTVLLKLAAYTGEGAYQDAAAETLQTAAPPVAAAPSFFGQWLTALTLLESGLTEVAVIEKDLAAQPSPLRSVLAGHYLPRVVAAVGQAGRASSIPTLHGRELPPEAQAAAWVCRQQTCSQPVLESVDLKRLLDLE